MSPEENLDEQLKNLAILAQSYPLLSRERKWALTQLVEATLHSGQIECSYKDSFYQEIYQDALQNLWLHVCQNIDKYDPQRGSFINWLVMMLHRQFLKKAIAEVADNHFQKRLIPLDINTFADNLPSLEPTPSLLEEIKEFIELDPENIFKKHHIKNHPEANFQSIVKRQLSGESWEDISTDLGIKVPTLYSFYHRFLQKYSWKFQEYLDY